MIEFLYGIAVFTPLRRTLKFIAHTQRVMKHRVREIKKKGLLPMGFDNPDGLVRLTSCQRRGIRRPLYHLPVSQQWHTTLIFKINHFNRIKIV